MERQLITEALLKQKDFTPSTLKTYVSLLNGVHKHFRDKPIEEAFNDVEAVSEVVENGNKPNSSKATIYSALYGITGNKEYHTKMKKLSAQITENYKQQKNTRKRDEAALTMEEIKDIYIRLAMRARAPGRTKLDINNALIAGLMSGVFDGLPPRRLMDYTEMRFFTGGAYDSDDNIIAASGPGNKWYMYFNKYKTATNDKDKGIMPVLKLPTGLVEFVNAAAVNNNNGYLLVNSHGEKFTPASLHARLLTIYGFGADMLRSIYISELHKNTPSIKRMEAVAKAMGHSVDAQMLFYVKK